MKREFEETMKRRASGIDSGNTSRCEYYVLFLGSRCYMSQERRFSRTRLSCKEHGTVGKLYQLKSFLEFGILEIERQGYFIYYLTITILNEE